MNLSVLIAMTIGWVVCTLTTTASGQEPASGDRAAMNVVRAMLVYDRAIASLEWEQYIRERILRDSGNPEDPESFWNEWIPIRDGTFGENRKGEWYFNGRTGLRPELKSTAEEITWSDVRFASTSMLTVATTPGSNVLLITEPQEQPRYYPGPMAAIGRWLKITGTQTLSELLLGAKDLAVQNIDQEKGLVQVRGEVVLNDVATILLVTVDTKRDFAPCVIRRFNAVLNHLEEELITERFERFEGHWIPTKGTRTMYRREHLDAAQQERLSEAVTRHAARLGVEQSDPIALRAATAEVFAGKGYPITPLAGAMHEFEVHAIRRLNQPLSVSQMVFTADANTRVFNEFVGLSTDDVPLEQVIEGCELITLKRTSSAGSTDAAIPSNPRVMSWRDIRFQKETKQ